MQDDAGLIPGLGRSPEEGIGNPLQYSWWEIPWVEEPGGLKSMGSQRVGHDLAVGHNNNNSMAKLFSKKFFQFTFQQISIHFE